MKFIKLTNCYGDGPRKPVYVNVESIETFAESTGGTRVGVISHNNGGWLVSETPAQIVNMIQKVLNYEVTK